MHNNRTYSRQILQQTDIIHDIFLLFFFRSLIICLKHEWFWRQLYFMDHWSSAVSRQREISTSMREYTKMYFSSLCFISNKTSVGDYFLYCLYLLCILLKHICLHTSGVLIPVTTNWRHQKSVKSTNFITSSFKSWHK